MRPWFAVAHVALLAIALARVWRSPVRRDRVGRAKMWWGAGLLVVASAAQIVFVGQGGAWLVLALVGTFVLAMDTLLGGSTLVLSLCTRGAPAHDDAPPPPPEGDT